MYDIVAQLCVVILLKILFKNTFFMLQCVECSFMHRRQKQINVEGLMVVHEAHREILLINIHENVIYTKIACSKVVYGV